MVLVQREMPLRPGDIVVGRGPRRTVRDAPRGPELEGPVKIDGRPVPRSREGALGTGVLSVLEHGAEGQDGVPVEPLPARGRREDALPHFPRRGGPLRPAGRDQDRYVDGPRGAESRRLQHPDRLALPLDGFSREQAAQDSHVAAHVRPRQRPLAQGQAPGESRTDGHRYPVRTRDVDQRRDGGCVRHRVAQVGHQHGRTETDTLRAFRGPAQLHPNIRIQGRRVVEPRPFVAEALRYRDMLVGCARRGERARKRQCRHGLVLPRLEPILPHAAGAVARTRRPTRKGNPRWRIGRRARGRAVRSRRPYSAPSSSA